MMQNWNNYSWFTFWLSLCEAAFISWKQIQNMNTHTYINMGHTDSVACVYWNIFFCLQLIPFTLSGKSFEKQSHWRHLDILSTLQGLFSCLFLVGLGMLLFGRVTEKGGEKRDIQGQKAVLGMRMTGFIQSLISKFCLLWHVNSRSRFTTHSVHWLLLTK